MICETFPVGLLQCNCTVLGDETSGDAMVIDPGDDLARILGIVQKHSLTLKRIVVTHAHIDHIAMAQQLKELTGAPVFYSQRDLPLVAMMDAQAAWLGMASPKVLPPDLDLDAGMNLDLGTSKAHVIATPGHTQGSLCLYLPEASLLLAGDTLFAGSVGRTDLPGGDGRQLLRSIHSELLTLPDETVVIAGHGHPTTIGRERERNPFLQVL